MGRRTWGTGMGLGLALALAACSDEAERTTGALSVGTVSAAGSTSAPGTTTDLPTTDSSTGAASSTSDATTGPGPTTGTTGTTGAEATSTSDATSTATTDSSTGAAPACGDGQLDPFEECDDGNDVDNDTCTNACKEPVCGDGIVGPGESCDDGNMVDDDACSNMCAPGSCGDAKVQVGEECDDGNMVDTDLCLNSCKTAKCGDMVVQAGAEECDDGNMVDNDMCTNACKLPVLVSKSCKAALQANANAQSGLFMIDPDGNGGNPAFQTYCDMTTDGGGWTLLLNRHVNADQTGQPDINAANGVFDNSRATNWNFDVDLFWTDATQFMFADKQNSDCASCPIAMYDSAIRVDKPAGVAYSTSCPGTSSAVNVKKIVGPQVNMAGTAYQCGTTLGWGSCAGKNCHFGVHSDSTANDGSWSSNQWNEMHFPSSSSNYKSYGTYNVEPTAWCRSCGGGLAAVVNNSSTCCQNSSTNAKARWTIWAR